MELKTIVYEVADRVATITLNRPHRLNAWTGRMHTEYRWTMAQAEADPAVRVVVVTGAGRGFCAGADSAALEGHIEKGGYDPGIREELARPGYGVRPEFDQNFAFHFGLSKPVIAAINGPAVGIGITMTLAMDLRLAADTAKMGFVFARRGIVPEAASSWFLPRLVGISQALEWCYSGRVFPATEALAGRLVRSLHPVDELIPTARALAEEIATNTSALSVALTRQMMWRMLGADHPMEAHKVDSRAINAMGRTADAREGVVSFLEKRPPAFPGRVSRDLPEFFPWWDEPVYE